ncbi:hypothetical protein NA78x_001006 [Anatilimnocola sp. NA78]|uniref:hypothetical protein n=1 Tax=Anatilimnocola sp. NA78 TaxID=3415683 RepID=UPI003CE5010A
MRIALYGLVAALMLGLSGCSDPTVSGSVTFDGQPLQEGYIAFVPELSGQGGGSNIVNGNYTIKAPAGKYKVEVTASKLTPLPPGQTGMDGAREEMKQFIPDRYNTKTELKAEVPASGKVDFQLKP